MKVITNKEEFTYNGMKYKKITMLYSGIKTQQVVYCFARLMSKLYWVCITQAVYEDTYLESKKQAA